MMRSVLRGGRGLIVVAVLVLSAARPVDAQTSGELQLLTLTNQVRASAGAPPLALDGALSVVAATWSTTMAQAGTISHNPALKLQISGFSRAGENVGVGASVESVHRALVASPGHYANIVNPLFSRVGIGVVQSGSMVYLTQVFVQPSGSEAPPAAAPAATTVTTAPRAAARAAVTTVTTATTAVPAAAGTGRAATAPASGVASPLGGPGPSAWHVSVMVQLEAWDRLLS